MFSPTHVFRERGRKAVAQDTGTGRSGWGGEMVQRCHHPLLAGVDSPTQQENGL